MILTYPKNRATSVYFLPLVRARRSYGEEPDPAIKAAADAAAAKATADAAAAKAAADAAGGKLTQAEVDKIIQERTAQYAEKARKAQELVQQLQSTNLSTAEERNNFKTKMEELQSTLMTKEQAAAFAEQKLKAEAKEKEEAIAKDRDFWKSNYTQEKITSEIERAAIDNDGFKAKQFVDLLATKAKLVEAIDEHGQPTGKMEVKIDWEGVQDGKPVKLQLSPADTVKAMKQTTDFANLFVAKAGGTGYVPTRGNQIAGSLDPSKMTTEDYIMNGGRERILKK